MKKIFPVILTSSLLIVSITLLAKKKYDKIKLISSSIVIDGNSNEWSSPLYYYDEKSMLFYDLKNDKENLYIAFSAHKKETIQRIMQNGIQLSIDTAYGKDDYPIYISYPLRANPPSPKERAEGGLTPKESHKNNIKISGFKSQNDTDIVDALSNKYQLNAAFKVDKELYFCEIKIPLAEFYKKSLCANDSIHPFFFQVTLEALSGFPIPQNDREDLQSPGRPGAPSMGSGFPSGGMSPGRPPGNREFGPPPPGMIEQSEGNTIRVFRFQLRPTIHEKQKEENEFWLE